MTNLNGYEQHHDVFNALADESFRQTEAAQSRFSDTEWQVLERAADSGSSHGAVRSLLRRAVSNLDTLTPDLIRQRIVGLLELRADYDI